MKIVYQCLVCDKVHETLEDAQNCHNGPVQGIQRGITRYPKKSFFGR